MHGLLLKRWNDFMEMVADHVCFVRSSNISQGPRVLTLVKF